MRRPERFRVTRWMGVGLVAIVLTVSACASGGSSGGGGDGEPQQGGSLTIAQPAEPLSFDSRVDPKMEGIEVVLNVQDPLITFDSETGELEPSLAESWEVSDDGLEYRFTLRSGVEFSDGSPFDSSDVVFTFQYLTGEREGGAYVSQFAPFIERVTAPDPTTVVVTMKQPFSDFPELLARHWACRILSQEAVEAAGDDYGVTTAVGTGPFMIEEWVKGSHHTIVRNPSYWGQPAYLDEVVYSRVPDGTARLVQAKSGQADVVYQPPLDQLAQVEGDPNLTVEAVEGNPVTFLRFNTSSPPFDDVNARRAVFYAVDTDQIRAGTYGDYASTATDFLPPWHWAADPDGAEIQVDRELAEAALQEAGYSASNPLTFDLTMNNESEYVQLGTLIQAQLQEVGITANLKPLDPATLIDLEAEQPDQYDATVSRFLLPTGVSDDYISKQYSGDGVLNRTFLNQEGGAQLPELDRLIDQARVQQDQAEAARLYRQVVDLLVDNAITLPIAFKDNVNVISSRVHNLHVQGTDAELLAEVWVE